MFDNRLGNYPDKRVVVKCHEDDSRFPIELLNLWETTELEIIGGNFTYFPPDISILKNLKKLSLISTKVSVIPKEIFELPSLSYLSLKNNKIDSLPVLEERSHIKQLILGRNQLKTESLESFFHDTPYLHYLDLGHNHIKEIPYSILKLKKLRRLNLENNKLSALPIQLKDLKELLHLSVNDNPIDENEKDFIEKNFNIRLDDTTVD